MQIRLAIVVDRAAVFYVPKQNMDVLFFQNVSLAILFLPFDQPHDIFVDFYAGYPVGVAAAPIVEVARDRLFSASFE